MAREIVLRIILLFVSIVFSLVIAETILHILNLPKETRRLNEVGKNRIDNPFPGIRYLYYGNTEFKENWPDDPRNYFNSEDHSLTYRINNYGFRGSDFSIKRNDKLRIAVIGDSFSWGSGVKLRDRFSAILEDRLNEDNIVGHKYEVYNFGLPGYNTVNEITLYEKIILKFQPDLLIVSFFLNDVNLPPDKPFLWNPKTRNKSRIIRHSRLARLILGQIDNKRAITQFEINVRNAYQENHPGIKSVEQNLQKLGRLNRQMSIPTLFVIFPWLDKLQLESYPFHDAHKKVRNIAQKEGFEVIDLLDSFLGMKPSDLWVHKVDPHPNELGNKIASNIIYNQSIDILKEHKDQISKKKVTEDLTKYIALDSVGIKHWYQPFFN